MRLLANVLACLIVLGIETTLPGGSTAHAQGTTPPPVEASEPASDGHDVVRALALAADGSRAAAGMQSRRVVIWSLASGRREREIALDPEQNGIGGLAFSPDGKLIAVGNATRRRGSKGYPIVTFDVATGEVAQTYGADGDWAAQIVFSPDGRFLMSVGRGSDPMLRMWSRDDARLERSFVAHKGSVGAVALSRDGGLMATAGPEKSGRRGSSEHTIKIWDMELWPPRLVLGGHEHYVTALAFTPGGEQLVSADASGDVRIWGVPSGRTTHRIEPFAGRFEALAVSPDGRTLALAGGRYGGTEMPVGTHLRALDLATGAMTATMGGIGEQPHNPTAVAYTADGRWLVTGGEDGRVNVWDAASLGHVRTLDPGKPGQN